MDPRLVEMGTLRALLDAPERPGWTAGGPREGAAGAGGRGGGSAARAGAWGAAAQE